MIELHHWPTPNRSKVTILLEKELELITTADGQWCQREQQWSYS